MGDDAGHALRHGHSSGRAGEAVVLGPLALKELTPPPPRESLSLHGDTASRSRSPRGKSGWRSNAYADRRFRPGPWRWVRSPTACVVKDPFMAGGISRVGGEVFLASPHAAAVYWVSEQPAVGCGKETHTGSTPLPGRHGLTVCPKPWAVQLGAETCSCHRPGGGSVSLSGRPGKASADGQTPLATPHEIMSRRSARTRP